MKKIYDSNERISDKAFTRSALAGLLAILLCIIALCSTTYAWFVVDSGSGTNVLAGSRYSLNIKVVDEYGNKVLVNDNGNDVFTCTLTEGKKYTVSLVTSNDTTAKNGYCDVAFSVGDEMHTEPISLDAEKGIEKMTFYVSVVGGDTVVTFEPKLGISAATNLYNGDELVIDLTAEN